MHLSPRNSAPSRQAIPGRGRSLFASSISTRRSQCNLNDRNITNRTRWNNMGLSWQQGPLATGAIGRFLVPEPLPKRLLYVELLRRRMRVRFGGTWIADSEQVILLFEPGRYPVAYFPETDISSHVLERTDDTVQHP